MNNKEIADRLRQAADELEGDASIISDYKKEDQIGSLWTYTECAFRTNHENVRIRYCTRKKIL